MTMKRIIYSCFLFTLLFSSNIFRAQVFNGTVTPSSFCPSPTGTNSGQAGVTAPCAGATSYTWTINSPTTGSATLTSVPAAPPGTSSVANVTYSGCGVFTLNCIGFNGVTPLPCALQITVGITCPSGTITASSPTICPGTNATLTANGAAATWTWTPGGTNGNTLSVGPTNTTTYTVVGTTPSGCTIQATQVVSVVPISVTITPATQTICPSTTVTLNANASQPTGVTYQWYNVTTGSTPMGTASSQTVAPAVTTQYSVAAVYNTCTVSSGAIVTIGANLSILPTASSPSVCPPESVTLTATSPATSYTWISQTGPTSTNNPAVFTGPNSFTVIGAIGTCTGQATIFVFPSTFTPGLTSSSPSVCAGEAFTLSATGGSTTASYSFGLIAPTPTLAIGIGTNVVVTSQTVQSIYGVIATSSLGCVGGQTIAVGMTPPLSVTPAISSNSVCAGSQVTITTTGAASYTLYTTTFTLNNTTGTFTDNPTSATVYSIIGSNAAGYCTSAPATVTINMISGGSLTVTASASASAVCPGGTVQLNAFSSSTGSSFTWTPAGAISGNNLAASVTGSPNTTTTYTVLADNGSGSACTGSAVITITVEAVPSLTVAAQPGAVCAGFSSTITASGASSYTWTGSTILTPIVQSSISAGPGTYTVNATSALANCPAVPVSTIITLSPPLNVTVSQSQYTTCIEQNTPIKLSKAVTFTASGASSYAWSPYNPVYMTYSLGPITTVRPPTSTCYTVTGSSLACTGTAVVCVTVVPQFTIAVTPPQPIICLGDSTKLTISSIGTLAVGPASAYSYSWTEPPNAPPPSLIPPDGYPYATAFPQSTSMYTVETGDARGCASVPNLVQLTVLAQPVTAVSIPTINNVPTNTVCFVGDIPGAPDNLIGLMASNANPGGLPLGVSPTFTWVSPYNPSSIVTNPIASSITVNAPKRLPALAVYTVISGYNNIKGCKRTDTVTVRIIDCRPIINRNVKFTTDVPIDTLCSRSCITYFPLTDTLAGGPQTYTWTFDGGTPSVSTQYAPTVCYNLPGKYFVRLQVRNPYPLYETPPGSSAIKSMIDYVKVVDIPNVTIVPPGQLSSDTIIKFGESVVLTGTNALKYSWSPNYNISSLTNPKVTVNPFQTTQYILTGYNSKMCYSTDTINVIVIEDCGDMFVPNAFSPNGDGNNDVLMVRGICLETMTFMIFNRWGEKVFETTDISVGWDGTYHGDKMNSAVFVYRLEGKTYSGKGFSAKGNITLIR